MSYRLTAVYFALGGMSALLCGCALSSGPAPVYVGPIFELPPAVLAPDKHPIPVTVIDARPSWEKSYYPGSNIVSRYDWAITFVPAENFRPLPIDSFRYQLVAAAAKLPIRPARMSVRLTSFQVVFDARKVQRQRHIATEAAKANIREQKRKEREKREREDEERDLALYGKTRDRDEEHESNFGEYLLGLFFSAMLEGLGHGITEGVKASRDPIRQQERDLPPPAKALQKRPIVPGVSSRVEATVTLEWHDGRTLRMPLIAETLGSPAGILFETPDVPANVRHTMTKLVSQMGRRARGFLAENSKTKRSAIGSSASD